MKKNTKFIGILVFTICFALGAVFNGLAFWSDLEGMSFWGYPESNSYDPEMELDSQFGRLYCPIFITPSETATVKAIVRNPKDSPVANWVQAHISKPGETYNLVRDKQEVDLAPGEKVEISWQVKPENILFDRIIFVRVFLKQTANHPPSATRHCGIFVRDLGIFTGKQATTLVLGISLLGMLLAGFGWWLGSDRELPGPGTLSGKLIWLTGLMALTTIFNLFGNMLLAGFALLLTFLSLLAIMENSVMLGD